MVIAKKWVVDRGTMHEIFTPWIKKMLWIFQQYKLFGWPFAGGWAEQPAWIVDIITTLEQEYRMRQEKKPSGKN